MRKLLLSFLVFLVFLNIGLYGYLQLVRSSKKIYRSCPVPAEHCRQGKIIEIKGEYFGIGYAVPVGTPILAVFDGQTRGGGLTFSPELGGKQFSTVVLTDKNSNSEADYILTGEGYQGFDSFSQEQEITGAREGEIADFGVNLIVRIRNLDGNEVDRHFLDPSS